jgi:hypothetical protein
MSSSRFLYGTAIFVSAFLLFLIEPMAAKQILPALGGSSAVWMTCLVFFQLMLLVGYLYAHWLSGRNAAPAPSRVGSPSAIHLALLALAAVVTLIQLFWRPDLTHAADHPVAAIFFALSTTIGLPFLLLASTSPLLQVWIAQRQHGRVPYRLFGLSNLGSLLALLLYPTLVEPNLTLRVQRIGWSIGFLCFAALYSVLALQTKRAVSELQPAELPSEESTAPDESNSAEAPQSTRFHRWLWFLLPAAAAMQLSAATGHLTQNVAAIPLLWILPLAVYLLTFILAFEVPFLYRRWIVVRFLAVVLAALGWVLSKVDYSPHITIAIVFYLTEIFFACWFLHAETYAIRPARPRETTLFYLLIAAGGVAGSFFTGIASPLLFDANYDIAIAAAVTAAAALFVTWGPNTREGLRLYWPQRLLWITGTALLAMLLVFLHIATTRDSLLLERNFYGALRVKESRFPPQAFLVRMLLNGNIQHGTQWFAPDRRRIPTTYYNLDSGIGLAIENCCADDPGRPRHIGIIGLGTGTLAAYGRAPQNGVPDHITFYEINPAVAPIARNVFSYIRDSSAQVEIIPGDARISLAAQPPQAFDVLAVDAFSSDAIPLHLLTREAMALYVRHLGPGGILAFHVSNQFLNLDPEIAQLAASVGLHAMRFEFNPNESIGAYRSTWVLVTADPDFFSQPTIFNRALPIAPVKNLQAWTDDYSSLLPILRWRAK